MATITIEDTQAKLPEIIGQLARGQELLIIQDDQVVARLIGDRPPLQQRPGPGFAKGMISIVAEDDEHLQDFTESAGCVEKTRHRGRDEPS